MARKPNYRFERLQRERLKAEKKAEKAKARAERAEKAKLESEAEGGPAAEEEALSPAGTAPPD